MSKQDRYETSKNDLFMYNLLCTVKPPFKEHKFPYNPWTPAKIDVTLNELTLYPDGEIFKLSAPQKKGGSTSESQIIVFTC